MIVINQKQQPQKLWILAMLSSPMHSVTASFYNDNSGRRGNIQHPKVNLLQLTCTLFMMIVSISSIIEFRRIMTQYKSAAAKMMLKKSEKVVAYLPSNGATTVEMVKSEVVVPFDTGLDKQVTVSLNDPDSANRNQQRQRRSEEAVIDRLVNDHSEVSLLPHKLHSWPGQSGEDGTFSITSENIEGNNRGAVAQYLSKSKLPYMISILKWNASGMLEQTSPIDLPSWWNEQVGAHEYFLRTRPSQYGTVAYFLNSDVLSAVPWSNEPPIPFLMYTLPDTISSRSVCNLLSSIIKSKEDDMDEHVTCVDNGQDPTMYKILPNPYDRDRYNLYCLELAEQTTSKVPWDERNNTIVWRGILHGKSDPSRRKLLEMSLDQSNSHWLDAVNVHDHPDAYKNFNAISYYKYQIDIGGESGTTWGSLRWKMCSGNLVFKVDTWSYDWWHSTIQPWKHYIPVYSNLSNLHDLYLWAEEHPNEVQNILRRAVRTCKQTIDTETIRKFHETVIWDLPSATAKQVEEVDAILNDNVGNFYQTILERGKQ
jgi:Glycosyl transferase family 90